MYISLHVKYPLFLSDFNETRITATTGRDEKKGKSQEKIGEGSRKRTSSAGSEKMERVGGR